RNYVATINAAGSLSSQIHDALGNLTQETDPNNNGVSSPVHTTYQYDALHRLLKAIDRMSGETAYDYDVNGWLKQVTVPNGLATGYVYDDPGNLLNAPSP